jgi:hypothetical protein
MAAVGLDPAGILCQIRAVDAARAVVLLRQVGRARMRLVFSRLPPCPIGMAACADADAA